MKIDVFGLCEMNHKFPVHLVMPYPANIRDFALDFLTKMDEQDPRCPRCGQELRFTMVER